MSVDDVVVEAGRVAVIRINRPEVHNALNASVLASIGQAHLDLIATGSTRAIVLTGTGQKAFSAGADLDEISSQDEEGASRLLKAGNLVMNQLERSPVPIVGAINGMALGGGCELALALTFSVGSTRASFGLPENRLGLIPGYGGTQRLAAVVGAPAARHLMLTGTRMSADRAHALGLLVVPPVSPDELVSSALELGELVAVGGPGSSSTIIDLALTANAPASAALEQESAAAAAAISSREGREGVDAFRSRRSPSFEDRKPGRAGAGRG